jgi:hypothetical protein
VACWELVCSIVGALPESELDVGSDHPAWRVRAKVLVRFNPGMRVPDEDAIRRDRGELIAVRAELGEREALIPMDPDTCFFTPHWETSSSVLAWLARVDETLLAELLVDA